MSAMNTQRKAAFDAVQMTGWRARALAIVAAIIVNIVILAVGRLLSGEFPVATVGSDDQAIGFGQVIVMTGVTGLIAWGLLAILERTTSRATAIWTTIGVIVAVLSMLGPIDGGVDTASKVVLALMHVGAAATIIPMMRRTIAPRA